MANPITSIVSRLLRRRRSRVAPQAAAESFESVVAGAGEPQEQGAAARRREKMARADKPRPWLYTPHPDLPARQGQGDRQEPGSGGAAADELWDELERPCMAFDGRFSFGSAAETGSGFRDTCLSEFDEVERPRHAVQDDGELSIADEVFMRYFGERIPAPRREIRSSTSARAVRDRAGFGRLLTLEYERLRCLDAEAALARETAPVERPSFAGGMNLDFGAIQDVDDYGFYDDRESSVGTPTTAGGDLEGPGDMFEDDSDFGDWQADGERLEEQGSEFSRSGGGRLA